MPGWTNSPISRCSDVIMPSNGDLIVVLSKSFFIDSYSDFIVASFNFELKPFSNNFFSDSYSILILSNFVLLSSSEILNMISF